MENSNETSLQVVNNNGILKKIANFIKKLFYKDNVNYISSINDNNSSNNIKYSFLKSIKFEEDPEKVMLLKIQDDFEIKGINGENAYELTKNLSDVQKQKLLNLYEDQIKNYENSLENHRKNILAIRRKLV